jgi:hypothetical protein
MWAKRFKQDTLQSCIVIGVEVESLGRRSPASIPFIAWLVETVN